MDRPTVIYILYSTVSAQQTNLSLKTLPKTMPFLPGVYIADIGPPRNISAPMVVQSPYYIRTYSCSCVVQILHCVSLHAQGMMRHPLTCTWIMCPSLSGAAGVPAVTDTVPADTA